MKEIELSYGENEDGRTVNPEAFGVPGIVQLGITRLSRRQEPTENHIHRNLTEIGFCLRGSSVLHSRDQVFPVLPGSFFVNQLNLPHDLSPRPSGLYVYSFLLRNRWDDGGCHFLDLPPAEGREILRRVRHLPPTLRAEQYASRIRTLFTRLFLLIDGPKSTWQTICLRQTFLDLIVLMLEVGDGTVSNTVSDRIASVIELIRKNPERHYSIDDLSRMAALSPTQFINQFRKGTGFPPIRFQLECRIQEARRLLQTTELPVSELAMRLGFSSLQHFSDTFTRFVGCSPSNWRRTQLPERR